MSVIIYQEHIEVLEEENAELQQRVVVLETRLKYYQKLIEKKENLNK
tara:strand:- start:287 stop:427 length:141 start_codon:yes stop_codon:yes gene_type:complete